MKRTLGLYVAWAIAAVLLVFAAVGRHPYSFYALLRWVCCAVFVYSTFTAHEENRVAWTWIFGALAVLYNPIFRVRLDRSTWISINWLTIGVMLVAAVVFWRYASLLVAPPTLQSSASGDNVKIVPVSRQTVAREWIIFLVCLPLGWLACFFLGYYWPFYDESHIAFFVSPKADRYDYLVPFDAFCNEAFGLLHFGTFVLWLVPYSAVTLIRVTLSSVSTLWPSRSFKNPALYSLLVVYLVAAFGVAVVLVGNIQHEVAERAATKTKYISTDPNAGLPAAKAFDPDRYLAEKTATAKPWERYAATPPSTRDKQDWFDANAPQGQITPAGYYFLAQRVDIVTAPGVQQSLPPGTIVRFLLVFGNSFDVTADGLVKFTVSRDKLTIDSSLLPPSARKDAASVQAAVNHIESQMGPFGAQ